MRRTPSIKKLMRQVRPQKLAKPAPRTAKPAPRPAPKTAPSPSRPIGTGPMDGTPKSFADTINPSMSKLGAGPPALMKKGGKVKSFASKKADGIATKGKTKGRFI